MKLKFLSSLALVAMTFGMASCSSEEVAPVGGESTVTLSVTLPDGIQSRSFGDGKTATSLKMLVYDVNDANKTPLAVFPGGATELDTDILLSKQVNLQLVNGKTYKVVCWAQNAAAPYVFDTTTYMVHANLEGAVTSDENLDAFYAAQNITVTGNTNETVKLYRPFAQLNIGTDDLAAAKTAGFEAETVTVTVPTYNTLDLLTGEVEAGDPVTYTFGAGALPTGETFPKAGYDYLSMNYILMPATKETVDVEFTVNSKEGATRTLPVANVPVQRNYRTNIYGSLLTNSVNVNVEIVPAFEGENDRIATSDMLAAILSAGNSATMTDDIDISTQMQLDIPADKDVVLNFNGKTLYNSADIFHIGDPNYTRNIFNMISVNSGKLTLTGNGKMVAKHLYNINVKGGAHLVIEDGTYSGWTTCVQVQEGVAEIKGGTFLLNDLDGGDTRFMLNCIDAAYKAGTAKIIVTGGTFVGFNPADNAAEGAGTNFVADGYKSVPTTVDGQAAWTVVKKETINVSSQDELNNALKQEGAVVKLAANKTYTLPESPAQDIIIEGTTGSVIDMANKTTKGYNGVTFKNLTLKYGTNDFCGIQHSTKIVYDNCTITGKMFSYADEAIFNDCTFEQDVVDYNIWTYGSKNITFNRCKFNCKGKAALVYNEGALTKEVATFNNCEFVASASVEGKAAIEIDQRFTAYDVIINNCTATGFDNGSVSGSILWNNKVGTTGKTLTVKVDGVAQTLKSK